MVQNMQKIVVKNSSIHGRGVFASVRVLKGQVIFDWKEYAETLSDAEVEQLAQSKKNLLSIIEPNGLFKPPRARLYMDDPLRRPWND